MLKSLTYMRSDGETQEISAEEVYERALEAELRPPFKVLPRPDDSALRTPAGRIACVCLTPQKIHRVDTVVEEIMFDNGLKLKVKDAVALQDAGATYLKGYQLIHPSDGDPYFRAKADDTTENNFESLEEY